MSLAQAGWEESHVASVASERGTANKQTTRARRRGASAQTCASCAGGTSVVKLSREKFISSPLCTASLMLPYVRMASGPPMARPIIRPMPRPARADTISVGTRAPERLSGAGGADGGRGRRRRRQEQLRRGAAARGTEQRAHGVPAPIPPPSAPHRRFMPPVCECIVCVCVCACARVLACAFASVHDACARTVLSPAIRRRTHEAKARAQLSTHRQRERERERSHRQRARARARARERERERERERGRYMHTNNTLTRGHRPRWAGSCPSECNHQHPCAGLTCLRSCLPQRHELKLEEDFCDLLPH